MNTAAAAMANPVTLTKTQVINAFWQVHSQHINSGASICIEMPITLRNVIGDDGVDVIATRLRNMIEAPVTTVEDVDRRVIQIAPSRYLLGHDCIVPGAKKPKAKAPKEDKVARPPNAFILYRQHHHPLVKAAHPKLHNNQISVILGTQWKDETDDTKARYINLAQKLKVKHFHEHPDYQYQPRKPSEKRRRMTRRKAAALAETEQIKDKSGFSDNTISAEGTPSSAEQSTTKIPDLPKTLGGKAVLELGDEAIDDEAFAAMLEKYNQSIPPANTPAAVAARNNGKPVVIYDEPSEAAQNDSNFYSSVLNYNPFAGNAGITEEMQDMMTSTEGRQAMAAALTPRAQEAAFDAQNEALFNAELDRDAGLGNWCYAFDNEEKSSTKFA